MALPCLDEGSGPPIVFLPGLGATEAMFGPQREAFRGRYRVIVPHLRGTGRSPRLTRPIATVIDRQCADLEALLGRLGIERVVLVGVSYGGAVALRFATRYPARVAGLVVVDSFAELRWGEPCEAMLRLGSYLSVWVFYLPRWLLSAVGRILCRRRPEARRAVPEVVAGLRRTEAMWQSLAMCGVNELERLRGVTCPTLGVVGGMTRTGVKLMERVVAAIPGARFMVVEGSFDPTNLWQPALFNGLLATWLKAIGW